MDIMALLQNFAPVGLVVAILGITWVVKKGTDDPATGKSKRWLLAVPLLLGFGFGIGHYYVTAEVEAVRSAPWWKNVLTAFEMAFGYAGAAVLLWELRKKIWKDAEATPEVKP